MDPVMVLLRSVHIGFGVFWVGSFLFLTFVLSPRLKALGPQLQGPVMGSLVPITVPVFITSALLVIGSGTWMALKLRWGDLDLFFTSSWGLSIFIGAMLTVVGFLIAFFISRPAMQEAVRLGGSMAGRPPTPEEGARMGYLGARIQRYGQITAGLLILAVGAMAVSRYV